MLLCKRAIGLIGTATTTKCTKWNQAHRSSRASSETTLGFSVERPIRKIRSSLPYQLYTTGDPRCVLYASGEADGESIATPYGRFEHAMDRTPRPQVQRRSNNGDSSLDRVCCRWLCATTFLKYFPVAPGMWRNVPSQTGWVHLLKETWKPRINGVLAMSWYLESGISLRWQERARTSRWSQTIVPEYCSHLFD